MSINLLKRKINQMRTRIDINGASVRHEQLAFHLQREHHVDGHIAVRVAVCTELLSRPDIIDAIEL
jgi:hypothetical protein